MNLSKAVNVLTLVGILLCAASCGGKRQPGAVSGDSQDRGDGDNAMVTSAQASDGITILLSEGKEVGAAAVVNELAPINVLPKFQADQLLKQVPPLEEQAEDKSDFVRSQRSRPVPRITNKIHHSFPPSPPREVAVPASSEAPIVTQFAPEGEVVVAPHLSVSFSQPMVAVTSHEESLRTIPVSISPESAGRWRWVGTKTLLFEPDVRFPMATEYSVVVKKGAKSVHGAALANDKKFKFATPALTVISTFPEQGNHGIEPVIYIEFDQRIDLEKVVDKIRIEVEDESVAARLATVEEIRQDKKVFSLVEAAKKKENGQRWIAVVPSRSLPRDSAVVVSVDEGTPSAEGARTTTSSQSFTFHTRGALAVVSSRCGWNKCPPGAPFSIEFNNPLDEDSFDTEMLSITPALSGVEVHVRNQLVTIRGDSVGRTAYTVTLPNGIKDTFGQSLGELNEFVFTVGASERQLWGQQGISVADPFAKMPSFDVHSVNLASLDVQMYSVTEKDWGAYLRFFSNTSPAPGRKVFDQQMPLSGDADQMSTTRLYLSPGLNSEGKGHIVVVVQPTEWLGKHRPVIKTWVQVTDIGLDAFRDPTNLIVWTTDLATGKRRANVDVSITHATARATSNDEGLASIPLQKSPAGPGKHQIIVAKQGADTSILPTEISYGSKMTHINGSGTEDVSRWFTFSDRDIYKPGETVHVKGWVRTEQKRVAGDLGGAPRRRSVRFTVNGPRGNRIGAGSALMNRLGGFDLSFVVPKTADLGWASVQLDASGTGTRARGAHGYRFQIREFRAPEFEIRSDAGQGPYLVGNDTDVTVEAQYYAGGALSGADVNWLVTSQATTFTPPNRSDFTFGAWKPWWGYGLGQDPLRGEKTNSQHFSGVTDTTGKHVLHMDFVSVRPAVPMSVVAKATVMDVNRQSWSTSSTMLIHPSDYYVGLKRERYFVQSGESLDIEGIVVDQNGESTLKRPVTVTAVRVDWKYKNGKHTETETEPQICRVTSTAESFHCKFKAPKGGRYKIIATVVDDEGRANQSELAMWVGGGGRALDRDVTQEKLTLIPNKDTYGSGETAKILVQAPFFPAEGVVTVRRSGIESSESFHMESATHTVEVPILDQHVPNCHVQVDIVGAARRVDRAGAVHSGLPERPAYATGTINLPVPPVQRTLRVTVTPQHTRLAPGSESSISVAVHDAKGNPALDADVAVFVVDESVLALSDYATPDPIASFYSHRSPGTSDYHQRQWIKLAAPSVRELAGRNGVVADESMMGGIGATVLHQNQRMTMAPTGAAVNGRAQAATSISVRKDFAALVAFAPSVRTDASGNAQVSISVPDNVTRYRVIAVAAAYTNHFGTGESHFTARIPLMIRPSPPRFVNYGDRFDLPVVVQNQTDQNMKVKIAARTTNANLTDGNGRILMVSANSRLEVRFPASPIMAGIARFQVVASSGEFQDANEFSIPVLTPATTEVFASYGEVDTGVIAQAVRVPPRVVTQLGGLEVTLASSQVQDLTDSLLYVAQYPYEGTEQISSRVLAVSVLRDTLAEFKNKKMPTKEVLLASVRRDIQSLSALQNSDGGFALWKQGSQSWPYVSIYAAHALAQAKRKGFVVPPAMWKRSMGYLVDIEHRVPSHYDSRSRHMLVAYALYVRKKMGNGDITEVHKLIDDAGMANLSSESLGWIMDSLHGDPTAKSRALLTQVHRSLANKVSETAATVTWVDDYEDNSHLILHSSRRSDSVILDSLITTHPHSPLIPKVVRSLLAHRRNGRWKNTQENSFVLLALAKYFHVYEKRVPNFIARMWLGTEFAGEQSFFGRSKKEHTTEISMSTLALTSGEQDLTLTKKGAGRLYYRIGMTYAPSDLRLKAIDHGFIVERSYEGVDDTGDVVRQKDGSWKIKAGTRVRVRLTMIAPSRRNHVALVDSLPAGLEPLNPELAVTGSLSQVSVNHKESNRYWWWNRTWYEHQNMRDERVEAFASLLGAGVHTYSYLARSTTLGSFVVPPAKSEEMYAPETFGRSASDLVIIE